MAQAAAIIALAERLRKQSRKVRNHDTIADLRLAAGYLRALAALKIADEAAGECDPAPKHALEREAMQLEAMQLHVEALHEP